MLHARWQRLFLSALLTLLSILSVSARSTNGLRWEKIHVYNASPTVVFAKLGLTHSTKNGYTRDGKRGVPDPTFPPGLTDVVPDDAEKLLLVRGTVNGLTLFRARVSAADTLNPPLHLHAELTRQGIEEAPLATQEEQGLNDAIPVQVVLGDGDLARVYQITERANPDGTYWIACRVSLPLPVPPASASAGPIFVPERIWTDPLSRRVHLSETAVFDDLASVRQAASRRLGTTGIDSPDNFTLRVTLSAIAAH